MQKSCYLDTEGRRLSTFQRLKAQYWRDGLTLFLGAGVSAGSGVLGWRDLLDGLLAPAFPSKGKLSCILSEEAQLSLPAQFSLVGQQCSSDYDFANKLFNVLYGSKDFKAVKALLESIPLNNEAKTNPKARKLWKQLQTNIEKGNPTLAAIGKLLLEGGTKTGKARLRCNTKIHAVMTTNVDNLLQNYVMALARGHRILDTVDRPSVGDHPNMISVFHLHGFLDARGVMANKSTTAESAAPDEQPEPPKLVFRESEYFDVIARPTGFANYTAHSFLQRTNVLFVGTSLEDVNMRRWLYTSYRERVNARAAYLKGIYEKPYKHAMEEARYASLRHFWLRSKKELPALKSGSGQAHDDRFPALVEELTRTLGIEIIWYNEHTEVAKLLAALKREQK